MNVPILGKKLKKFLNSESAYKLLDSAKETRGSTWTSGGCWALAQALYSLLPDLELVAVVDNGVQHHILVQLNCWYLDADGASNQRALLSRWRNLENLKNPKIAPFRPGAVQDLVCPADLVRKLRTELQRLL